jgi:NADPH-dependent curcumin reductase CurA
LKTIEVGPPGDGEVQLRNRWLSIDPAIRGRMFAARSYVPPFQIGDVIAAPAIGEVVGSNDPRFAVGELVITNVGWCEYANVAGADLERLPDLGLPPQTFLGIAGITGLTAYVGLERIVGLTENDVFFVSAGAGAVGAAACLIAKRKGCKVVAATGGPDKAAFLKDEIGVDAVIDYRAEANVRRALAAAAPEGIDVYFDNVGGVFLEAAIACANLHARFAICGMIAGYNAITPLAAPRNLTLVAPKSLQLKGFIVLDHVDLMKDWRQQLTAWHAQGALVWRETISEGIESAPAAFAGLFSGQNLGKTLVYLPDV